MRNAYLFAILLFPSCSGPSTQSAAHVVTADHQLGQNQIDPQIDPNYTAEIPAELPPTSARENVLHAIRTPEQWNSLRARPATSTIARTEVVKFLVDTHDGRLVHFIDTERYEIHYFFARDNLNQPEPVRPHELFNVIEYRRAERRFEMGSLVHYEDGDIWTMELVAGDTMDGARIVRLFEHIRGLVYFGDRLRFRSISPVHDAALASIAGQLPLVTTDEVFRGVRYEPLTLGVAYGYLRTTRGALDAHSVRADQILLLENLPDEIPVASAVISAQMQAPLGHIALLCANRRTPNMALRDALNDARLQQLEGQLVRLEVGAQDFMIAPASLTDASANWATRRPSATLTPVLRETAVPIRPLHQLRLQDASLYGAKAAQLGEADSIRISARSAIGATQLRTPGGFAIPFSRYRTHMQQSGANTLLPQLFASVDHDARLALLAQIRARILAQPVQPALVREIHQRWLAGNRGARWIFRSSTNAEDLDGFTGAGLYRSIVIPVQATPVQIENALQQVWSSVWLDGAQLERDWYRVDSSRVAMGVLAQPFVDGAAVNGVALTCNPFYQARPGFLINAQPLGGSVTGGAGNEMPEQHLVYTYMETLEMEQLSRSSRSDAVLLSESDLNRLSAALGVLHAHFLPRWTSSNGVDVEFLLAGPTREVIILQARPFNCVYGEGQRWE